MDLLSARLRAPLFQSGVDGDVFLSKAAAFPGEPNAIHPFRDGNGRVQPSYLHLVALRAGHPLQFDGLGPEAFMPAMIQSFDGEPAALREELAALRR